MNRKRYSRRDNSNCPDNRYRFDRRNDKSKSHQRQTLPSTAASSNNDLNNFNRSINRSSSSRDKSSSRDNRLKNNITNRYNKRINTFVRLCCIKILSNSIRMF
jgi:hypothetical protein